MWGSLGEKRVGFPWNRESSACYFQVIWSVLGSAQKDDAFKKERPPLHPEEVYCGGGPAKDPEYPQLPWERCASPGGWKCGLMLS